MEFKLFKKFASLEGLELVLFIAAAALFLLLLLIVVRNAKKRPAEGATPAMRTRALVYGALCLTLSFVLSYFKLFSMPFGGSITLCSMLPIVAYACYFGPAAGFLTGLAYAVLQIVQGAYIVHWVQFLLDYFVAFTVLGIAGFFPKKLPAAMLIAGFARMLVSTVSGAVFFGDSGFDYGIANPWAYSILYNGLTIGVDTVVCAIVSAIPAVRRAIESAFGTK